MASASSSTINLAASVTNSSNSSLPDSGNKNGDWLESTRCFSGPFYVETFETQRIFRD